MEEHLGRRLSHLYFTVFLSNFTVLMIIPAMPDVTLSAVCPGKDECSAAIYITGLQKAVWGIGSAIMTPLIGNLSDAYYGRTPMLTLFLVLNIFPPTILAWKRTASFFYAYCVINTLISMITQGGIMCISAAYLADNVSEGKRISAFGLMYGATFGAYFGGTLAARLLSTDHIFRVSAAIAVFAAIYMRVFVKENSNASVEDDSLEEPILETTIVEEDGDDDQGECFRGKAKKIDLFFANIPSPKDVFQLLKRSAKVSLAASIVFFNSLAEVGVDSCLMYYLKARFHFGKDQFADVLLITYVGATLSNMVFMPTLGSFVGEEILVSVGQFAGFLNRFLDSIAWASWVPYASASFGFFILLSSPNLNSIVSKHVGPNEQGLAQGCLLGTTALANLVSPLIFSPLSAWFLGEDAPFHYQGFSILSVGLSWLIGFLLSLIMNLIPNTSRSSRATND